MSLSMIKSQFKEFISHFERQDMTQVFDYLKSALTEYQENPKQFIDDVLDVKNEPVEKPIISGEINEKCHICNKRMIDSKHYGVYSCSACYKFFQRSLSSKVGFRHSHSKENPPKDVLECRRCRIDKCMSLGMQIPVKKINYCEICRGIATGVRYGVNSCFQCAKFYSKILTNSKEAEPKCKKSNSCPLDKSITRMCAGCRLQRFKSLIELNNQNKK